MTAALAIALLALWAGAAEAGFRYVPPGKTGAVQAEEIARSPGAADMEPPPGPGLEVLDPRVPGTGVSGPRVWRVHEGEMLRAVLARWAARAGTEVLFLTDRRYRLDGAAAFAGGFSDAVQALFRGLSYLPHAPVAARSEGGSVLVVRHRMPASPGAGGKP